MVEVELIFDRDCPNVGEARTKLLQAFKQVGMSPQWKEWDREDPQSPSYAKLFGSPTILIGGKDISGEQPSSANNSCRVYQDSNGKFIKTPPLESLVSGLQNYQNKISTNEKTRNSRGGWKRFVTVFPVIGAALLPKLTCPACWPAYAGLLSALGIGFVNYTPYLLPLTMLFVLITLFSLGYRASRRRGIRPLLLGSLAAIILIVGRFGFNSDLAMYGGLILLIGASIWNSWPVKTPKTEPCPSCPPAGVAEPR